MNRSAARVEAPSIASVGQSPCDDCGTPWQTLGAPDRPRTSDNVLSFAGLRRADRMKRQHLAGPCTSGPNADEDA